MTFRELEPLTNAAKINKLKKIRTISEPTQSFKHTRKGVGGGKTSLNFARIKLEVKLRGKTFIHLIFQLTSTNLQITGTSTILRTDTDGKLKILGWLMQEKSLFTQSCLLFSH